ncbi:acyltransferase family protein [Proteus terrae]|uniref:acyltransferase family protein n=1 Tax=Proteus terrae TaxID=1574161 RepID=UPI00288A6960|nr:acyltransferase [Proteus terrae]
MLYSIHYIRGISALLVVLFHLRPSINNVYAQKNLGDLLFLRGDIGVDAFFIISGFIICHATRNDKSIISFSLKRFFRIYPTYLLFSILFLGINLILFNHITIKSFFDVILIRPLNYSMGPPFYGYTYLVVGWSLVYEICFYIIYLVSMSLSHKYRNTICSLILFLLCYTLQKYYLDTFDISATSGLKDKDLGFLNILSASMMLNFIVGIFIYEITKYIKENLHFINKEFIKIIFFFVITVSIYFFMIGFNSWHGLNKSVLFIAPLILSLIIYEYKCGLKKIPALIFLGNISYSLYLSHLVVTYAIKKFGGSLYNANNGFSTIFIAISLSLIVSYISYNTIEKTSSEICRKIIMKIKKSD